MLKWVFIVAFLPGCQKEDPPGPTSISIREICDNEVDDNQNGYIDCEDAQCDCDADGDSYKSSAFGGPDCDDEDWEIHPRAIEICDGRDNDCDTLVDDEDDELVTDNFFYRDDDLDGYGNPARRVYLCEQPSDGSVNALDCDDTNHEVNPSAVEICDGRDNDCDGWIDDGDSEVEDSSKRDLFVDADGDGYGSTEVVRACSAGLGAAENNTDCDDTNPEISPGSTELTCDAIDNDCDPLTPDDPDVDLDGLSVCSGDCFDTDDSLPVAAEVICNGLDDDCDGSTLDGPDEDGDLVSMCTDCDDTNNNVHTVALWSIDDDDDGYGVNPVESCGAPSAAYSLHLTEEDCDDTNNSIHPNAPAICGDEIDEDCSGILLCDEVAQYQSEATLTVSESGLLSGEYHRYMVGMPTGQTLCELQYQVLPWTTDPAVYLQADPIPPGSCFDPDGFPCTFSSTVNLRQPEASGDLCDFFGLVAEDSTGLGWGFVEEMHANGSTYGQWAMYYFQGYGWYPLTELTTYESGASSFYWGEISINYYTLP